MLVSIDLLTPFIDCIAFCECSYITDNYLPGLSRKKNDDTGGIYHADGYPRLLVQLGMPLVCSVLAIFMRNYLEDLLPNSNLKA